MSASGVSRRCISALLGLLLVAGSISGCGQSGPLVLREPAATAADAPQGEDDDDEREGR